MKSKIVILSPLIILFLIAVIGILAIFQVKSNNGISSKLDSGKKVELPTFSFENLETKDPNLISNELALNRYSILNLFASWCVTCLAEHDILLEISKLDNVKLYGIAYRDINENTIKYLKEHKNPYYKVGVDRKGELEKLLAVKGIPETFVIDDQGRIVYRHKGNLTLRELELFKMLD